MVRPRHHGGYELVDAYGMYVGYAVTLAEVFRFAHAVGGPLTFQPEAWAKQTNTESSPSSAWLRRLVARIRLAVLAALARD